MGCIVNGPGEMADADFGYVGSGVGKITVYKGKEVMKKDYAILEQKYKRQKQKIKSYDQELKHTREQASDLK